MRVIFTVVLKSSFHVDCIRHFSMHVIFTMVLKSPFQVDCICYFCMRVIFTVVLKSPFPSGLYPPLLYACHFYCGVEESISKWTVSATFVCVSF